jgi:Na+/H+ antiporter NhaD/arsenite permease-like protein
MVLNTVLVAAAIFVFTYALISFRNLPGIRAGRGAAAAAGGTLMVLFGIVSPGDVPGLINHDVILLLLGMMMLVIGLEFSGFFGIVSGILVRHSGNKVRLLAYVMIVCAVLSAIALNDAIVLIFTPIVIKCCRSTNANPIPYLIGVMFSANIGSLITPIGNPQNAYIASEAGIPFADFAMHTIPVSILCLPVAFLLICIIFRKNLTSGPCVGQEYPDPGVDRIRLRATVTITLGALIGFAVSDMIGIETYVIAMTAGTAALAVVMSKSPGNIVWVAKKIDWGVLVFFIGLFVLIGGVSGSGLLDQIASLFPGFGEGETPSVVGVTIFSAILSNLVSNVPATVMIADMLPAGDMALWLALAASSTLAGNATLIGSAANVIVTERSAADGISFDFWKFALIGIPVASITLLIAAGVLILTG